MFAIRLPVFLCLIVQNAHVIVFHSSNCPSNRLRFVQNAHQTVSLSSRGLSKHLVKLVKRCLGGQLCCPDVGPHTQAASNMLL
jgi:hypothetical protein